MAFTEQEDYYFRRTRMFTKKRKNWVGRKMPEKMAKKKKVENEINDLVHQLQSKETKNGFYGCAYCGKGYNGLFEDTHMKHCKGKPKDTQFFCQHCQEDVSLFNHSCPNRRPDPEWETKAREAIKKETQLIPYQIFKKIEKHPDRRKLNTEFFDYEFTWREDWNICDLIDPNPDTLKRIERMPNGTFAGWHELWIEPFKKS